MHVLLFNNFFGRSLLSDTVHSHRLSFCGHLNQADSSRTTALQIRIANPPADWRRRPGRSRQSWLRMLETDLRSLNLGKVTRTGQSSKLLVATATFMSSLENVLSPTLLSHHLCLCLTVSDHFPIFTKLSVAPTPLPPPTLRSFRRLHSIDIDSFISDLKSSELITNPPTLLDSLLPAYNSTLSALFDKHAPVISKLSRGHSKTAPWFTPALRAVRSFRSEITKRVVKYRLTCHMSSNNLPNHHQCAY